MSKADLTPARLRELLDFDPETGVFVRRKSRGRPDLVGTPAGAMDARGYLEVYVAGRLHKAHRLAWLYVHGVWPDSEVDHLNGVRSDNRLANLRVVTRRLNRQNLRRASSHNKLGLLGVSPVCKSRKYQARIQLDGQQKHLGVFDTPEQAHQAYLEAKRRLHEGCTL